VGYMLEICVDMRAFFSGSVEDLDFYLLSSYLRVPTVRYHTSYHHTLLLLGIQSTSIKSERIKESGAGKW